MRPPEINTTKVGPGGRVPTPVELRRALKLAEGTILVARVDEDRLILERPATLLERAQARFAAVPDRVSLSDELLADRCTEGRGSGRDRTPVRVVIEGPCVHDASALLAMLQGETGAERVEALLDGSVVSTVTWAEVIQKAQARGVETRGSADELSAAGLRILPFDLAEAERCGLLWADTSRFGFTLGDRACLAAALERDLPVLTADHAWTGSGIAVTVESIR